MRKLREYLYSMLEDPSSRYGHRYAVLLTYLIILNILGVILETVPGKPQGWESVLRSFEIFSVLVFTIEYLLRLWACTVNPRYAHGVAGRVRYALSPIMLVDLLAILPFYLPLVVSLDLRVLRALRLFRFLRIFKISRYSDALQVIGRVSKAKRAELAIVALVCGVLLLFASTFLYYAEHAAQPDVYSSIPASLWWGVATVTTVGYGDIVPVTTTGKAIASLFALISIAIFALPAGIFAGAFAEEIKAKSNRAHTCPSCGTRFTDDGPTTASAEVQRGERN